MGIGEGGGVVGLHSTLDLRASTSSSSISDLINAILASYFSTEDFLNDPQYSSPSSPSSSEPSSSEPSSSSW